MRRMLAPMGGVTSARSCGRAFSWPLAVTMPEKVAVVMLPVVTPEALYCSGVSVMVAASSLLSAAAVCFLSPAEQPLIKATAGRTYIISFFICIISFCSILY